MYLQGPVSIRMNKTFQIIFFIPIQGRKKIGTAVPTVLRKVSVQ